MAQTKRTKAAPTRRQSKYRSNLLGVVHRMMADAHDVGAVDKVTMREFDRMCLTTVEHMSPAEIQALRTAHQVSQTVFAALLNVSKDLVSQWERGEKRPSGPSLKLLSLVKAKGLDTIR